MIWLNCISKDTRISDDLVKFERKRLYRPIAMYRGSARIGHAGGGRGGALGIRFVYKDRCLSWSFRQKTLSSLTIMDWQSPDIAKKYKAGETLSAPFALHLIRQAGLDKADGSEELVVLDNACGTGVVTLNIYEALSPAAKAKLEVVCGDFSPGMVKSVQERIEQNGWTGASAKLVDAQVCLTDADRGER